MRTGLEKLTIAPADAVPRVKAFATSPPREEAQPAISAVCNFNALFATLFGCCNANQAGYACSHGEPFQARRARAEPSW